MQLRYFSPQSLLSRLADQETTSLDLVSLLPKFVRNAVQQMREEEDEEKTERTNSILLYFFFSIKNSIMLVHE